MAAFNYQPEGGFFQRMQRQRNVYQVSNQNVHMNDSVEVNASMGHHEVHGDSESRDLPESDCPLPPNTDSHKDDDSSGLQEEIEQNEAVVPTAQNQQEVPLSDCSNRRRAMMVTDSQAQELWAAFICLICKGPFQQPMYALCCLSLVGCKVCVLRWRETSSQCPKCGEEENNVYEVTGITDALTVLRNIISVE